MKIIGKTLFSAATTTAGFLLLLTSSAPAAVETKNLLHNGDFEEAGTPPPGWDIKPSTGEACEVASGSLTGNKALKISLPVTGNVTATSAPTTVVGDGDYLFTYWGRAEGTKEGGALSAYLVWQDNQGKTLATTPVNSYSPPTPDYRTVTFTSTAPSGATRVLVQYRADRGDNKSLPALFYVDQVRLMKLSPVFRAADAQKWEYVNRSASDGLKFVDDPDAAQGKALASEPGVTHPNTYLAFGPYTLEQPVGEYLALFHLKVKDNTRKDPVVVLDINAFGGFNGELANPRTVLASDFKQAGVYQDIAVRFIRPEEGTLEFRVAYLGGPEISYDKVTIVKLADFATDEEQNTIWLGNESATISQPAISTATPAVKRDTVLVIAGLGQQTYFPTQALPPTLKVRYSYLACLQIGSILDQPFPKKLDQLNDMALIVLADVPADALDGLMGRRTLRQFVEQGGGLLVFGGPLSLGKGGYMGSVLEPILPISLTGPWDLAKIESPRVTVAKVSPITDGLRWNEAPILPYCQKTTAKANAEILLECDGLPVLATGRCGKGKIAVFTGTYLGEPVQGNVPFYHWSSYPELLKRVSQWLINR